MDMDALQVFSSPGLPAREDAPGFTYCPRCASELRKTPGGGVEPPTCPSCGFIAYRNPLPGVVVLVERDDQVLLGRRAAGSFRSGLWCLPGGFMEWAEDFLGAGRRETREETGLEIKVRSILSVVSNFLSPSLHTLVIVLLATPCGGELRAGDDLAELSWFPLGGKLPEMAFEADRHIVERFAADRLAGAPVDPRHGG
jgi:8-oxo-dGTP diphosphatase